MTTFASGRTVPQEDGKTYVFENGTIYVSKNRFAFMQEEAARPRPNADEASTLRHVLAAAGIPRGTVDKIMQQSWGKSLNIIVDEEMVD